jgi:hypothetical protein
MTPTRKSSKFNFFLRPYYFIPATKNACLGLGSVQRRDIETLCCSGSVSHKTHRLNSHCRHLLSHFIRVIQLHVETFTSLTQEKSSYAM